MKSFKELTAEAKAKDNLQDVLKKHRSDWEKLKRGKEDIDSPKMEKFYAALFDYFISSGEMPYGTAKGRTGDPYEWISDRLMDEGTSARQRGEIQSPRTPEEYDALSPKDKKIIDKRIKNAKKQSMSRQPGESPRNKRTKKKPRNRNRNLKMGMTNEGVLMVRTQKTKDGKSYEWLVQKVEHNNTETIEKGTESSRAKAMAAGKKAKKNIKNEETVNEAKTMGGILKKVKKGTPPYTVVAMVKGKVVDQQSGIKVASQVPAIIKEFQGGGSGATDLGSKHGGEVKIAVEDKDSRVVYSEQTENNWNNEETINEELAYLPSKNGKQTFVVSKRNTKGMRGKQDKFSMSVIDTKTGKEIEDIGSHVSLKGAIKYGLNRGFVHKKQKGSTSEIKYNQSYKDLSKSFKYDTLTGKRNESSGGGGHPRKALNFDERQKAYASAYRNVHKKAPSRDELRAAGVGKGFEKSFGDTSKGVKAWKAAMEKLKKQDKRKQFNWRQEYQYN